MSDRSDSSRAALLAALDPDDEALRQIVGDAYCEGMRAFLDNLPAAPLGTINAAMQDAGARAVIIALRAMAEEK